MRNHTVKNIIKQIGAACRKSWAVFLICTLLTVSGCAVREITVSDLMTENGGAGLQVKFEEPVNSDDYDDDAETANVPDDAENIEAEDRESAEDDDTAEDDEPAVEDDTAAAAEASEPEKKPLFQVTNLIKPGSKADWEASRPKKVKIVAIGDMLMHPPVSGLAFKADGSIDYSFIFDPIRDTVQKADIAVVNNEVPMAGNHLGLQNYPNFNVFTELGDAEVATGFNVILNATNHTMDQGVNGALNTLNYWKQYPDITVLGIHETQEARDTLSILEVNGIRIAMLNYAYGSNGGVAWDRPYLLDLMTEETREQIRNDLIRAEEEADITIVFPHWGEEYHLQENGNQQAWAAFFTENGADLIIGTHPHCLEPIRTVTAGNGKTSLCYYSLGNYISMQDESISMLGGLAKVTIVKDKDGTRIADHGMDYLVTQYEWDMNMAYVVRLGDYTEELLSRHGIRTHGFQGDGVNAIYPLSMNTFYNIANTMDQAD